MLNLTVADKQGRHRHCHRDSTSGGRRRQQNQNAAGTALPNGPLRQGRGEILPRTEATT